MGNPEKLENSRTFLVGLFVALIIFSFLFSAGHRVWVFRSSFEANVSGPLMVKLTNERRTAANLPPLVENPRLFEAARRKAEDMASRGYFEHNAPDGRTPWSFMREVQYDFLTAGENLAIHFSDSAEVVQAWLNSPGHRDNILNNYFTEIGIATAHGFYDGRQTTFVVQMFGQPRQDEPGGRQLAGTRPILFQGTADREFLPEPIPGPGQAVLGEKAFSLFGAVGFWERIIFSPSLFLALIYGILSFFVVLGLIFAAVLELKKRHYRHLIYGLALLFLILLMYFVQLVAFNRVGILSL